MKGTHFDAQEARQSPGNGEHASVVALYFGSIGIEWPTSTGIEWPTSTGRLAARLR